MESQRPVSGQGLCLVVHDLGLCWYKEIRPTIHLCGIVLSGGGFCCLIR